MEAFIEGTKEKKPDRDYITFIDFPLPVFLKSKGTVVVLRRRDSSSQINALGDHLSRGDCAEGTFARRGSVNREAKL